MSAAGLVETLPLLVTGHESSDLRKFALTTATLASAVGRRRKARVVHVGGGAR
jgi:hypothetical protein